MYGTWKDQKKKNHDWDRDLSKDIERLKDKYGCDVLVSLVRSVEMNEIQIPNLFEEVKSRGILSKHYPIKDKWIPNSMEGLIDNVEWIIARLKEGKTVVCHCNGGKGRSGTLLVATLIGLGRKVQQSIDVVRKARAGTIRNPLQIAYVMRFKTAWKKHISKKAEEDEEEDEKRKKREERKNKKSLKAEEKERERTLREERAKDRGRDKGSDRVEKENDPRAMDEEKDDDDKEEDK
eukprot:TRINITY_DN1199_c5_g1_i4.p2 TRINITY_DN1199_c5_g1~~TRINITY_DN1199_c5_g1_i4.p2  ORF type:complete len:235 (+),score=87.23 TRINITY_DN1199_c5_g1_i4:1704-2408(+)